MSYTESYLVYIEGVPDKEGLIKFYMETTRTTRIVSILVSLVLLGQGDIYGYKYKPPRRRGDMPEDIYNTQANTRQDKPPDIDVRDKPRQTQYGVSAEANKRDLALYLISPSADSRRKTTISSTTNSKTFNLYSKTFNSRFENLQHEFENFQLRFENFQLEILKTFNSDLKIFNSIFENFSTLDLKTFKSNFENFRLQI
uniref:Uncharacterized protein n=1 Tax=Oryza sativa subsp. japonica TaxID=39947 RepID=Q6YV95_ORYSJ|nr:hypothetical protein [Oryza sativa Japonica Group]